MKPNHAWLALVACPFFSVLPALAQTKATPVTDPRQPAARPAAAGQPGAARAGEAPQGPPPVPTIPAGEDPDLVTLAAFSEPVALTALISMVGETLRVNITSVGEVPGSVVFNAPVEVSRNELLPLLESLLEQQGYTLTKNRFGWYTVHPISNVGPNPGVTADDTLVTTRVFRTPNLRPSSLKTHLEMAMQGGGAGAGQRQYAYLDDLGIILATDTPRRLDSLGVILDRLVDEHAKMDYVLLDLEHVAAAAARDRALQLVGQIAQPLGRAGGDAAQNAQQLQAARAASGPPLDNLGDRLTVARQGNALIFRGTPAEIDQVQKVLALIDVPNNLVPRSYEAGSSAAHVANIAQSQGLGDVVLIEDQGLGRSDAAMFAARQQQQGAQQAGQGSPLGGPMIVVDRRRGRIVYYGTESQQQQLDALLKELDTEAEQVVLRVYKLRNAKAEDLQEIILGIIQNRVPTGGDLLLPGDSPSSRPGRFGASTRTPQPTQPSPTRPSAGDEGFTIDSDSVFVIADIPNNQLIVKAPAAQQPEFARLIERLDLRRPQVYVEAKIVAVTADDQLRTAFETQLINASGTGGVFQQAFGLSTAGTGGTQPILNPRLVAAGLTGFTGAIVRSDQVPIIMTALANETDSRVIASPQLLVDDNELAKVATIDNQPVSVISRGISGQGDLVTSGVSATAETSLEVTPHISDGGYLRLEYTIKLENFTGSAQQGLAPPKLTNNINSDSITVPSDSTVIIGGLVIDNKSKTIAKIPLLGDIPLVGLLFQDRTTTSRKTVLYVFLTPRILREPTFADLKLLTRGPQGVAGLTPDIPVMSPSVSEITWPPPATPPATPTDGAAPAVVPPPAPARPTTTAQPHKDSSDGPSPDL